MLNYECSILLSVLIPLLNEPLQFAIEFPIALSHPSLLYQTIVCILIFFRKNNREREFRLCKRDTVSQIYTSCSIMANSVGINVCNAFRDVELSHHANTKVCGVIYDLIKRDEKVRGWFLAALYEAIRRNLRS